MSQLSPSLFLTKSLYVLGVLFCLSVVVWPHRDAEGRKRSSGDSLLSASGQTTTVKSQLKDVTLLHFWATWCPPCLEEIPRLQALEKDLESSSDFKILYIAVADSPAQVQAFMSEEAADKVLYDNEWTVAQKWGTEKLPETYLVVDGEVQEKFVGATDWTRADIRAKIRSRISG